MGPAGRQLGALLWKDWLCRRRHPVLSLAEFLWPCILFTILIVLRVQEPPRHRDNCYLQPRDLPSGGVFPFIQGLLCNTGARCRNTSYVGPKEHHFHSSRFQATAAHHKIEDVGFLQEMQDLADEICETMDKATHLKKLWVETPEAPELKQAPGGRVLAAGGTNVSEIFFIVGSPQGSGFLSADLSTTEEVISTLESLHRQPRVWDFLLSLPRLHANGAGAEEGPRGAERLLQAALKVFSSPRGRPAAGGTSQALEDGPADFLLFSVDFLGKLLLPDPLRSPGDPTETVLNAGRSGDHRSRALEREPPGADPQGLRELGRETTEHTQTLREEASGAISRFADTALSAVSPRLLAVRAGGISKGERAPPEPPPAPANPSLLRNERSLGETWSSSRVFRPDRPESPAVTTGFVHLSEAVIRGLCDLGLLRPEQASGALGAVAAVRNASGLFSALPGPQRQDFDDILTDIYRNVFKGRDPAFLLQVCSSYYQSVGGSSGTPSGGSLLSFVAHISQHVLEIATQFNAQNTSRAFAFLHETAELLAGLPEASHCQQLLPVFSFVELQAGSPVSSEGPGLDAVPAALTGLKHLLRVDRGVRRSLFQHLNRLLNSSAGVPVGDGSLAWGDNGSSPVNCSVGGGPPITPPWAQILSNLSADGGVSSGRRALHCSISWLRAWTEIWASVAQALELDTDVFTPLRAGLTQLLRDLGMEAGIPRSCPRALAEGIAAFMGRINSVSGEGDSQADLLARPEASEDGASLPLKVLPDSTTTFLSSSTVTADVKVKDLMRNITALTEELRSLHISDGTVNSILEANISRSQVLSGALTVALSGRCDQEVLRLLLAFPEDGTSRFAARELCGLPRATVYSLLVSMSRNLDLRSFIYKVLIPAEARGMLGSLSAVVSRLSHLLPKASRVLDHLPETLHALNATAWLDAPDSPQAPHGDQARSSAFGSFQSVMKMVCKEQESFLSSSHMLLDLPRVHELVGDDKEKFNIPEGSTPFCLKLYQEILQSPNGALVWSFLKPIIHGKILYTPNTPEMNKVIQKANHTFVFVDKLRTLSETLLKVAGSFQSGGSGQMLEWLQKVLESAFIRRFVENQLHIDVDTLMEKLQTFTGSLGRMLSPTGTARLLSLGRAVVNLSSCVELNRFQGLESVAALEAAALKLRQENSLLASVIFNISSAGRGSGADGPPLPPRVAYTLRTSVLHSLRTDRARSPLWKFHPQSLPAEGFKYNYVFAPLQDLIERALLLAQAGREAAGPATQAQAIPYPCHHSDLFLNNVGFFLPLVMVLAWMVSVASMVRKLVYEREIQMEEHLRMMGAPPAASVLAWLLGNVAVMTLSSAALAAVLKASGIFAHSDARLVFLFLLDFGVSAVTLSYLLSALFGRAAAAGLCSSLLYLLSFLPYVVLLVLHSQLSPAAQTLLCLFSTTAFGQGVFFITFLEGQEAGVQWGNLDQPPEQGGMAFGWVCWMILVDSGLYFLGGWYLSNLIPGTVGLRKPWHFPFTASYWKGLCGPVAQGQCPRGPGLFSPRENVGRAGSSPQHGKGEREGGAPGVTLVSVTKEYQPHQAAVRDLTLTFHRDQITALLGTNGAGKTTVMSLVTGLLAPTSGTILVDGRNLQTDLSAVRKELGVCPQRDVLFDRLTVREHLLLFAAIKSPQWTWAERRQQVDKTLLDVGLTQHRHKQARALSGGLKRRLSIGAAFLGSSRTVVLDEPTSGVDPCSRRSIWDTILRYRKGRTIIFTTHHLDEAEALSDRVAVLQRGRLCLCGPPLCLTAAHSQGLSLVLTKQPSVLEVEDPKDTAHTTALIQAYIPQAFLKDSSGHTLSYAIPRDADRAGFKGLFQALEQHQHRLHLAGFGVSDTTLEQRLQEDVSLVHAKEGTQPEVGTCPRHGDGAPASTLTQVSALLTKRLCGARRAWRGSLCVLLLPVLFVALAMGLFMVRPLAVDYPPLQLTPGHYGEAETYFFSSESDGMGLTHVLLRQFEDKELLCATPNPDLTNSSCWHTDPLSRLEAQGSCGCLTCPNASARASYLTNRLGHTLLNLSAVCLEEYLLLPSEKPRLGGWSFGARAPDPGHGADSSVSEPRNLAKVWYNQKAFHSLPSYLNHLNNVILWRLLPPGADWRRYGITLYSHPYGGALLSEDRILEGIRQCGVALCILLGFSVLSASIGSSVVRDRVTGAKRLQHISGLGYGAYWLTHFLFDMLSYLVSAGLCVVVVAAFGLPAFTSRENLAATALLLALFGYATLPWMYLMSRVFSSSDVAFIAYVSLNFILGLCTMLMATMPRLLAIVAKDQTLQNIYKVLKWAFTVFPPFCLGQGLIELCYNQVRFDLAHSFGIDAYASPFETGFLGWTFVQLASQGTVLLLLRLSLHWDLVRRPRGRSAVQGTVTAFEDRDVAEEQTRVLKGRTGGDLLVLCNLSKSYGGFSRRTAAVQDVSLGLRRGECFGLLGVNGAGKSTTFKMLSGDEPPTAGHAVVRTPAGVDAPLFSAAAAGVRVGYCPQQDALDELLTGREHLHYYCRLRGIPAPHIPEVAGDLVRRLQLGAHVDKPVATYSRGTQRKLSVALALLGKPDLLLLDEPSSGMDPCSKRSLWEAIRKEVQEGCAAVLTSHSVDECEALCARLAIMVGGSFRCLGSPQHVRDRFGDGYTVRVWVPEEGGHHAISGCLELLFPGARLKGQRLPLLEFHVPKGSGRLADLLQVLENSKAALSIRRYAVGQASLEQVFIDFATEQQPAPGPSPKGRRPPPLPV
ncbi:PREDICTED: ATP-binding cassette sub-family A member 13 [Miniopterus natalensis]|uniref:ATP-binding cassette sub-family A member 13 n=1 Tax=Miniopterus natalensis TaxID=291302 RepID=UPI0007A72CFA|nr:PREDICTED: ATP-binding cassette sub-family A member 13 [Miniopterus natalensis]